MAASPLRGLRNRGATYGLVLGSVLGMLVAGLGLPFVFGERPTEVASTDDLSFETGAGSGSATGSDGTGGGGGASGNDAGAGTGGSAAGVPGQPGVGTTGTGGGGAGGPGQAGAGGGTTGTGSGPGGAGGASTAPAPGGGNGATDQGVRPDAVRIGVFIADLGSLNQLGAGLEIAEQDPYEVYFKALNDQGGVRGRLIEPVYITYDPLSQADLRRACVVAAEDEKVFAVLNLSGFYGPAVRCLTEEYGVPLLNYSAEPDEWYGGGRFFTLGISMTRILRTLVAELDQAGALEKRTIGILDSAYPTAELASETALLPELADRGYKVAHRCTLSADRAEAQAQIPVCIQQMRAAGVNVVLFNQGYINTQVFLQQAESAGFRAQWFNSDAAGATVDAFTANFPRSYDGAIAVTGTETGEDLVGLPESPTVVDCLDRYEASTGFRPRPWEDPEYLAIVVCSLVDVLAAGLDRAGNDLTRAGYTGALDNFGEFGASGLLASSFRPGKHTAGDSVRFVRWHYDYGDRAECKCWVPISDPHPMPY